MKLSNLFWIGIILGNSISVVAEEFPIYLPFPDNKALTEDVRGEREIKNLPYGTPVPNQGKDSKASEGEKGKELKSFEEDKNKQSTLDKPNENKTDSKQDSDLASSSAEFTSKQTVPKEGLGKTNSVDGSGNPNMSSPASSNGAVNSSANLNSKSSKSSRKKKLTEEMDPTESAYNRGVTGIRRGKESLASPEFQDASSKEGKFSNPSKIEETRLSGRAGNDAEGISKYDTITEEDSKWRSKMELARSLESSPEADEKEKAFREYLKVATDAPKDNPYVPWALVSMAKILYDKKEYKPALRHLADVILQYPNSDVFAYAHYLSGKTYERFGPLKDRDRAAAYYEKFLKIMGSSEKKFHGTEFVEDAKRSVNLLYHR